MLLLLLTLLVGVAANTGAAFSGDATGGVHLPPLIDCAPAPVPAPTTDEDTAFRANLAVALGALPSAAALDGAGFAVVWSGRSATDRAFARGLCFDALTATAGCPACLSAAARDVAVGCGRAGSRRGGAWRAGSPGCFVAYADTGAPSAREDAFRGWFYADGNTTASGIGGDCTGDRSTAECGRCFDDSDGAAAALGWLPRLRGEEVVVVGYNCFLRVQIFELPQGPAWLALEGTRGIIYGLWIGIMPIAAAILVVTFFRILQNL